MFSGGPTKPKAEGDAQDDTAANKVDLRKVRKGEKPHTWDKDKTLLDGWDTGVVGSDSHTYL